MRTRTWPKSLTYAGRSVATGRGAGCSAPLHHHRRGRRTATHASPLPSYPPALISDDPMKTLSVVLVAAFLFVTTVTAQKFDMTGEWVFEVQTDAGSGSPTFSLKQTGEKVTGKY